MPRRGRRRKKTRTHETDAATAVAQCPKSFVVKHGKVGGNVSQLVQDMRSVMRLHSNKTQGEEACCCKGLRCCCWPLWCYPPTTLFEPRNVCETSGCSLAKWANYPLSCSKLYVSRINQKISTVSVRCFCFAKVSSNINYK